MKIKLKLFHLRLFSIVLLLSVLFINCDTEAQRIQGSKNVVSETREVPFFNSVVISRAVDLVITQGDDFHVEVRGNPGIDVSTSGASSVRNL